MILRVSGLEVGYGDMTALRGLDLAVAEGKIVALLGSNGAGKTTFINTVCGLLKPRSGQIDYNGIRIDFHPPHRIVEMGVVQVPEGRKLFPKMTVLENLQMGAYVPRARARVIESLDFVFNLLPRLKERTHQIAGTLSGGEQQMVALARGLMALPKLLILDEPSLGLAPLIVDSIFETVKEIKRNGITVLLVEQNVRKVLLFCDFAVVLENGRIGLSGSGSEMMENPYIREAFLGI